MTIYKRIIAEVPLLGKLHPELRKKLADILADIGTARILEAGETLYEKGAEDPITGAVVVEGTLEALPDGGEPIEVSAPELVGEMQQFDPYGRRTATLKAKERAAVLEFPWHDFVARILEHPGISQDDQASIKSAFESYVGDRLNQLS